MATYELTPRQIKEIDEKEIQEDQHKCHFMPMEFVMADDWPNGQVSFWECKHCGHTKEISRDYSGL